jgi:hypothetical protein
VETQRHADTGIGDIACHHGVDRPVVTQAQHVGNDPHHVREAVEGYVPQLFEAHPEYRLAGAHIPLVTRYVGGCEAGDFSTHGGPVTAVIEGFATVEADAVERGHRTQGDVVSQLTLAQGPEFFQQERRRDDGGTGIEGEAVLAVDPGPATGAVQFLQHRDPVATCAQSNGGGEPAEAAADDHGMGFGVVAGHRLNTGVNTVHLA